jgi:uncharacterized protein with LGFP repeats
MHARTIGPMPGVRSLSRTRACALFIIGLLVAALFVAGPQPASQTPSASAAGFDAGNIIDDVVFYDNGTMTESGIQSFLNAKGASCTAGALCLKNYKVTTSDRPADAMCKAYNGATSESAARIIHKVAQACGINPQVLIVMLEKEQSLVTMKSPTQGRYNIAMGYGCPDFSLCDKQYYGLFNQLYKAGSQLIRYTNPPGTSKYFTWFGPGKTVPIQWHPNVSCGTSKVYVANKATASLYYYTPYQPNAAALRAGWGTGDGCSAYGNRNFYNFFTSWFGSTRGNEVDAKLAAYYQDAGGASGELGSPIGKPSTYSDGGVGQQFTNYRLYWSTATGFTRTTGSIGAQHANMRGPEGILGYPNGVYTAYPDGGRSQSFQNGTMYWSPKSGMQYTTGVIRTEHDRLGAAEGTLGYPTGEYGITASVGRTQVFQRGTLYWSPASGSRYVTGALGTAYQSSGGPAGALGFPIGDYGVSAKNGRSQSFQNGSYYWTGKSGSHYMMAGVDKAYNALGGVGSAYGYPTSDSMSYPGNGYGQDLTAGAIYWSPATSARLSSGELGKVYKALGGPKSVLGYPTGDYLATPDGGRTQAFQNGTMYWSKVSGAQYMLTGLVTAYAKLGGVTGAYGYPTEDTIVYPSGGYGQKLRSGWVYWSSATGVRVNSGAIGAAYAAMGGPTSDLGYPTSDYAATPDGQRTQKFQKGTLFWSASKGVYRG